MKHLPAPAALALGALVLGAACGGDGGGPSVVATRDTPPPAVSSTGITNLDQAIDATLAGDEIEMAGLTGYQQVPCESEPEGAASGPRCRQDEQPGDLVEVLPVTHCDRAWVRPEEVPETYVDAFGEDDWSLVAVYVPQARPLVLDADHIAVFTRERDDAGIAFSIKNGRLIAAETDCGDLAALYAPDRVSSFLISPDGGSAPSSVTPTAAP
jgi:hypothetical protein